MLSHSKFNVSALYPRTFVLFTFAWGLINLVQAILTEITEDEAYYWMYAQYPDWGYFDHPPMISAFIQLGTLLSSGEIGVRLVTVLAQIICLYLIWYIVGEKKITTKKIITFFILAFSIALFQVFGFIATPDSPLLLFTAFFLLAYQLFLRKESLLHTLLLGLAMAGLVYSKYHGILVIIFVLASNYKILFSPRCLIAGALAMIIGLPHLLWQVQHDFPSLRFHLVSRADGFNLKNILDFFPNQFVSFNPFFLCLFLYLAFLTKARTVFERGLYFVSFGFLGFFFISSFNVHVEPQWTIAAAIPMMIIVYQRIQLLSTGKKYVYRVLLPSILFLLAGRAALTTNILPAELNFHGKEAYYRQMDALVGDRPLIFESSYQSPSLYTFFTGRKSTSLNGVDYRRNQYDLWNFEEEFFNQSVMVKTNLWNQFGQVYVLPNQDTVYLKTIDSFSSVQKVRVVIDELPDPFTAGDSVLLNATVENPYPQAIPIWKDRSLVIFFAGFFQENKAPVYIPMNVHPVLESMGAHEKARVGFHFRLPELEAGKYHFGITMQTKVADLPMLLNSKVSTVQVMR